MKRKLNEIYGNGISKDVTKVIIKMYIYLSFRNDGDSNNNSVNKEVVLSPSRTRSRRSSTNSQTSSSSGE